MLKKYIGIFFVFFGCVIIATAISMKLYTHYKQEQLIDKYREYIMEMEDKDQLYNKEKDSSLTEASGQQSEDGEKPSNTLQASKLQRKSGDIIGILSIPKIDLSVAIGEGVAYKTLKYCVGHFSDTAMPGENGNLCIVGHRSYSYGEFFNRLDEIEAGDKIKIESDGQVFSYKVTDITVVKPEEVSVLDQTKDAEITLITCTPIRIATHRLIIRGVLVDK